MTRNRQMKRKKKAVAEKAVQPKCAIYGCDGLCSHSCIQCKAAQCPTCILRQMEFCMAKKAFFFMCGLCRCKQFIAKEIDFASGSAAITMKELMAAGCSTHHSVSIPCAGCCGETKGGFNAVLFHQPCKHAGCYTCHNSVIKASYC